MSEFQNSAFAKFLKKNKICPVCNIKRLIAATKITADGAATFVNGAALTPPMGWASWNVFGRNIDESIIYETALAMKTLGLDKLGYTYVNIDDCWMSTSRDKDGRLYGDMATFPSGMKALCEKINSCGFKAGIYTSNGTHTCEDRPSSLGYEAADAETFARWGFEYFKYDFCHNVSIPTTGPEITGVEVTDFSGNSLCRFTAEDAQLRGTAERFAQSKPPFANYIGGLNSNGGAAIFDSIEISQNGEYVLNLYLNRSSGGKRYCEIVINGVDTYSFTDPAVTGYDKPGKCQLKVRLEKGTNTLLIHNPISSRMDSAAKQYRNMGKELMRATRLVAQEENREEKPICYSICEWGLNSPWKWGRTAGNLWRTTPDIRPSWLSIVAIYERNVVLDKYASVGHWNDPDMLEVGNGELTFNENRAHFTLWCMMAAPLILGNDLRKFLKPDGSPDWDNKVLSIITEKEAIEINQDPLGVQCKRVKKGMCDVLVKPLENGELAVCLFNKGKKPAEAGFDINELTSLANVNLKQSNSYSVRNVWDKTQFVTDGKITQHVKGRDVVLYRIKAR